MQIELYRDTYVRDQFVCEFYLMLQDNGHDHNASFLNQSHIIVLLNANTSLQKKGYSKFIIIAVLILLSYFIFLAISCKTLKQFDNTPFRVQGKRRNRIYLSTIFVKGLNILMMHFYIHLFRLIGFITRSP